MNIEYTNQNPPVIRGNFNRDSSAVKSRGGYVIHSGVHRSTAFVILPHAVASLERWKALGQVALNGWVEGTIAELSLDDCECNALAKLHPAWKFSRVQTNGFGYCRAQRGREIVGGLDWRDLRNKI